MRHNFKVGDKVGYYFHRLLSCSGIKGPLKIIRVGKHTIYVEINGEVKRFTKAGKEWGGHKYNPPRIMLWDKSVEQQQAKLRYEHQVYCERSRLQDVFNDKINTMDLKQLKELFKILVKT